jgi:hypothetical protein
MQFRGILASGTVIPEKGYANALGLPSPFYAWSFLYLSLFL